MSDVQERAAEVILDVWRRAPTTQATKAALIAKALAERGLLADDDTARLRKLGEAVEARIRCWENSSFHTERERGWTDGWNDCIAAIRWHADNPAGVTPEDGR